MTAADKYATNICLVIGMPEIYIVYLCGRAKIGPFRITKSIESFLLHLWEIFVVIFKEIKKRELLIWSIKVFLLLKNKQSEVYIAFQFANLEKA